MAAALSPVEGTPSRLMEPASGSRRRSRAARTVDLPAPDPPVRRDSGAGRQIERDAVDRGLVAVRVGHAEALDAERRHRAADPGRSRRAAGGSPLPGGSGVASTSSTREAAACPSALAWNSAPARRRGMKISGATSRTAIAVCRSSSPRGAADPTPWRRGPRRTRPACPWTGRRGRRCAASAWWPSAPLRSPPPPRADPAPGGRRRAGWAAPRRAGGNGRPTSRAGAIAAPTVSPPHVRRTPW